jgi:hypothetical protein
VIFYHYSDLIRDAVYGPYLAAVETERRMIREAYGIGATGSVREELTIGPNVMRFLPSPRI